MGAGTPAYRPASPNDAALIPTINPQAALIDAALISPIPGRPHPSLLIWSPDERIGAETPAQRDAARCR